MDPALLLSTFVTVFLAELGDKTQLATVALSGTSNRPMAVFLGSSTALVLANATFDAVERLGVPECRIPLSQCATYLASSPKSNSAYAAIGMAQKAVRDHGDLPVPMHLRNAPTKLMKDLGYAEGYRYAHNEPNGYPAGSAHDCWPDTVPHTRFFAPSEQGQEKRFKQMLDYRAELDAQADRQSE